MAEELFLIDGNSLVYRAFFALPESIATSDGRPTNAIFGFASMLVKILTDYGIKPTVVVWDAGSSGRKEVYAEYKAQRRERPSLLAEQWPQFEPLVEAFGYPNVSVSGYEADDVIATLAEQAKAKGLDVMVVTGDRDAYQLVDDGTVKIMTTSRGITDTRVYDREGVIERYGIPPELVPDFIGLKGDTSDNIPGVPGIGDKTAAQLLNQFGSLEEVLAHVDDISGKKRQENLREFADDARVSKQLATMVRDVDVEVDLVATAARRARSRAPAGGLPRLRAARPAAPAGGGARLGRRGRAAARGRDAPDRARAARHARRSRRGGGDRARRPRAGGARGPAVRRGAAVALGGVRRRRRGAHRRGGRSRVRGRGGGRPAGDRPRRQGAAHGAEQPHARHRGRRVPARPFAARLSARGARPGPRDRRRR